MFSWFGLLLSITVFFPMASCCIIVVCIFFVAVPVIANRGTPKKIKGKTEISQIMFKWLKHRPNFYSQLQFIFCWFCVWYGMIINLNQKWDLFLKEINGFMLNVTDHYCISPATSKGGFPVIRVICHESVIYVTGHVSHRSEAQGLLPRITRQSETFFPPFPPVSFILP